MRRTIPPLAFALVSVALSVTALILSCEPAPRPARTIPPPVVGELAMRGYIELPDRLAVRYGIDRELARTLHRVSFEEGVDTGLVFALVRVESAFEPRAVSPVGAVGLAQVMPATGRWFCGLRRSELFRPEDNVRCGVRYLKYLLARYGGDLRLALLAYNRGPGTIRRVARAGGRVDNGYADAVLR